MHARVLHRGTQPHTLTVLTLTDEQQSLRPKSNLDNMAQRGASDVIADADDAYESIVGSQWRKQPLHALALVRSHFADGEDHEVVAAAAGHVQTHELLNRSKQIGATQNVDSVYLTRHGYDVFWAGCDDVGSCSSDGAAAGAEQVHGKC
jgi:hypothetical protein